MCDLVVARAAASGPGGKGVKRGTVLCADDPVARARPQLFRTLEVVHHCGGAGKSAPVETTTAAPGEVRDVKLPASPQRPPTSGPGSGIDAWRKYAAAKTGESEEALAELGRDDLIELAG